MALRTRFKFTLRVTGSMSTSLALTPMYVAPLSNAACAVTRMIPDDNVYLDWSPRDTTSTHMSGSVMPLTSLAQSLYVLIAMTIDSVPPDVIVQAPSGLLYILRHMATISASILRIDRKTPGWSDSRQRSVRTITLERSSPPSTHPMSHTRRTYSKWPPGLFSPLPHKP